MCLKSAYLHAGDYDLVIVDEVHRALSKEYRRMFRSVTTKALMCLTATLPENEEYVTFLNSIAPVVYEKNLVEAMETGMAPKVTIYNLPVPLSREIAGKYKVFDGKFTQNLIKLTRFRAERPELRVYSSVFDLAQAATKRPFDKEVQAACTGYWSSMTLRKYLVYSNPAKIKFIADIINKYDSSYK